jgi:hypothetical protein
VFKTCIHKTKAIYFVMSIWVLVACETKKPSTSTPKPTTSIEYNEKSRTLCFTHINDSTVLPDSLKHKSYYRIFIQSKDLVNYQRVFNSINPDSVELITIFDYRGKEFDINLKAFKQLADFHLTGKDLETFNAKDNFDCTLNHLIVASPALSFIAYQKRFDSLKTLLLDGCLNHIPNWIEQLPNIHSITIASPNIHTIDVDICKLKELRTFDISETPLYKSEMKYFSMHQRYNTLAKFKKCNPALEFYELVPPY